MQRKLTDFDHFLQTITPAPHDVSFSLLKAHLLFEELINAYLETQLRHPAEIRNQRLTFAQSLALARACSAHLPPADWKWEALLKLNKLRNLLAHKLDKSEFERLKIDYVRFIEHKSGQPLPPPAGTATAQSPSHHAAGPMYSDIDMVNALLFGVLPVTLGMAGFDQETAK